MEAPPVLRQARHALSSSKGGFEPGMEVLQPGEIAPKPEQVGVFTEETEPCPPTGCHRILRRRTLYATDKLHSPRRSARRSLQSAPYLDGASRSSSLNQLTTMRSAFGSAPSVVGLITKTRPSGARSHDTP